MMHANTFNNKKKKKTTPQTTLFSTVLFPDSARRLATDYCMPSPIMSTHPSSLLQDFWQSWLIYYFRQATGFCSYCTFVHWGSWGWLWYPQLPCTSAESSLTEAIPIPFGYAPCIFSDILSGLILDFNFLKFCGWNKYDKNIVWVGVHKNSSFSGSSKSKNSQNQCGGKWSQQTFFISEGGNWGSTASDNQVCNHLRNMKIHKSMGPSESPGRTGSHSGLETLHIWKVMVVNWSLWWLEKRQYCTHF